MSEFLAIVLVGGIVCALILLWVRYEGAVADWLARAERRDQDVL